MKKVVYLGHYDIAENSKENRAYWLAATNKMDYIANAMNQNGYDVTILSASRTKNNTSCPGHVYQIGDNKQLILFPSLGLSGMFSRILRTIQSVFHLSKYFIFTVKKNDNVIVYHSLSYAPLVRVLKCIKRFRLIIEVNEIYSDVSGSKRERIREERFFKSADAYIFSTELLETKVNKRNKPFVINYGTYKVESGVASYFKDSPKDAIHLVYAGTFSKKRGAAERAALTAKYLSPNYHVHLLGTGDDEDKLAIERIVKKLSSENNAKVSIDGLLDGQDYINFLHSCDAGFSTQFANAAYNDSSFPSKVLSYLANGLRVISVRIPVMEKSMVNDLLYYYEGDTPQEIAKAIQNIDWGEKYDSKALIDKIDKDFVFKLGRLLNEQKI